MPNINVYIRSGDLEKFQALKNKSEFIHYALKGKMLSKEELPIKQVSVSSTPSYEPRVSTGPPKRIKPSICKQHGIDKNLCRMMKH